MARQALKERKTIPQTVIDPVPIGDKLSIEELDHRRLDVLAIAKVADELGCPSCCADGGGEPRA